MDGGCARGGVATSHSVTTERAEEPASGEGLTLWRAQPASVKERVEAPMTSRPVDGDPGGGCFHLRPGGAGLTSPG